MSLRQLLRAALQMLYQSQPDDPIRAIMGVSLHRTMWTMDIVSAPPVKMSRIGRVRRAGMAVHPPAGPTLAAGPRLQPWLQRMATPTPSPFLRHTLHIILHQPLHHHMAMALAPALALAVVAPILESSLGQLVVVLSLSGSRSLSTASVAATTNQLLLSLISISRTQARARM